MPNWCINVVSIIGEPDDVLHVADSLRCEDNHFSLNQIHPEPMIQDENGEMVVHPDWYDWRVKNWGTKWDVASESPAIRYLRGDDGSHKLVYTYQFDSAWNPPMEAMVKLAELFPTVFIHIHYDEPGMDYSGVAAWQNQNEVMNFEWGVSPYRMQYVSDAVNCFIDENGGSLAGSDG